MDSSEWSCVNPCCGHLLDYVTDEALWPCGPIWKRSQCCPPVVNGLMTSPSSHVCAPQTCRSSWIYLCNVITRREIIGSLGVIWLLGNILLLSPHLPIIIYIEGHRMCKSKCEGIHFFIIPYSCIKSKNNLAVYIWKSMTNRDLPEVKCGQTKNDQFCLVPTMLFFLYHFLQSRGKRETQS